ncbi:MAG: transcription antitermination factor NusB [Candidatus Coatesbacteria bacterium]|nr:transcription antitermination factor NusB [Candidatus Coatesbacteria bacterium]
MGNRHRAREIAIQLLYQCNAAGAPLETVIERYFEGRPVNPETRAYAELIAEGTHQNVESIDAQLAAASLNWSLDRILLVDLTILRLAAFEILFVDTAPAIVIDEAIRLAKRFSSQDSPAFINGVLDAICKSRPSHEVVAAAPRGVS